MKDRLNQELDHIVFEGREDVLKAIKMKENQPSLLSKLLNYELCIPVPVVAVAISICLIMTVRIDKDMFNERDHIYVINEGGAYEIY